ncbi:MAG: VOC family protein [Nannocystaceae bacterium]
MDPRITVITLGVESLARARRFYCDGLGWPAAPTSNEHIVFIDAGGVVLALFSRSHLADDAQVKDAGPGFRGVTLAHNVGSRAEVDAALTAAVEAGAKLLKPAQEVFWGGYSGYFADPDGHAWEVAHNPFWQPRRAGCVVLSDG